MIYKITNKIRTEKSFDYARRTIGKHLKDSQCRRTTMDVEEALNHAQHKLIRHYQVDMDEKTLLRSIAVLEGKYRGKL